MQKLKDKVALVTGGSQGIGKAISCRLASEGATVVIINRDQAKAMQVIKAIKESGGNAFGKQFDLSKVDQIDILVDELKQEFGSLDILVNNAGTSVNKSIEESSLEDWQTTLNVNLTSTFFLSKAVASIMKENHYGKIINISSVADRRAFPNAAIYSISKAGLTMLSKAFVSEYAAHGINVNTILPGNTATPINQHLQDNPDVVAWIKDKTPSGRAYLTAEEVANVVAFLASDESSALHGAEISVDNGWLI